MNSLNRPTKRPRTEIGNSGRSNETDTTSPNQQSSESENQNVPLDDDLYALINCKEWEKAVERVKQHPEEVSCCTKVPSPLALCCRYGAPFSCVKEVLDAAPHKLRHLLDARGTPLHEAIVCEETTPDVVGYLLQKDEELGSDSPRAAVCKM